MVDAKPMAASSGGRHGKSLVPTQGSEVSPREVGLLPSLYKS